MNMTRIRRYFRPGNIYFLTHVTYRRRPILVDHADLLWDAIDASRNRTPFDLIAWSILPDHLHMIIDPLDNDLSNLMRRMKLSFSTRLRKRVNDRSGRIWQYRYWDHIIRDQKDLNRHIDYVHYNPVKHGLVSRPIDYSHSSFRRFCEDGLCTRDWCADVAAFGELEPGE